MAEEPGLASLPKLSCFPSEELLQRRKATPTAAPVVVASKACPFKGHTLTHEAASSLILLVTPACFKILEIRWARHRVATSNVLCDLVFKACGYTGSEEILENIPSPFSSEKV